MIPRCPVPMQCLTPIADARGPGGAHSPDIVWSCPIHCIKDILRAHIGAWNNAPRGAVPVLYQRIIWITGHCGASYRPDIVGPDHRHPVEFVVGGARTGTGYNTPGGAVPVLRQRSTTPDAYGPNVVRAGYRYAAEDAIRIGVWTGHNTPSIAVPVLCQRRTAIAGGAAHRPDVRGRVCCHAGQ